MYIHTFNGRPLVSIGSKNAASDDNTETPIIMPMAEWKLYASNVCVYKEKNVKCPLGLCTGCAQSVH